MKIVGVVFSVVFLLAFPLLLDASGNRRAVVVQSCYPAQVQSYYAAPAQAYYATYPAALGVGYNASGELVDVVKELIKDNREMRSVIIEQLRLGPGAGPLSVRAEEPHVALARANCASCHDAASHKGGFAMFDTTGRLRPLSGQELGEVMLRVASKDPQIAMPKGKKMTADDRLELIAGFTKAPPEAAQPETLQSPPGKVEELPR